MIAGQSPEVQALLTRAGDRSGQQVQPGRALNLTADGAVVEAGDETGAFVLCGEAGSIPADLAKELGKDAAPAPAAPDPPPSGSGLTITTADKTTNVTNIGSPDGAPVVQTVKTETPAATEESK